LEANPGRYFDRKSKGVSARRHYAARYGTQKNAMESENAGNKKPATLNASRVFCGIAFQALPATWWPKGYKTVATKPQEKRHCEKLILNIPPKIPPIQGC
jgi:hypothetical protein